MSEPITKRANYNRNNFSHKNIIISHKTASLKTNQKSNKEQSRNKSKLTNKGNKVKNNFKIKVKRKENLLNNNNILSNQGLVLYIKNNFKEINNDNLEMNKDIGIDNEKYSKDSDFYPKSFYINNYNNNYININNITIDNTNNEKTISQDENFVKNKRNSKKYKNNKIKNKYRKKCLSQKNIFDKIKSFKEEIIISDDDKNYEDKYKEKNSISKDKNINENKSLDYYSIEKEKSSNLSCLLSSSKNNNHSFYSKTKANKNIYNDNYDSFNNINRRKKEKSKKKIMNISLNYRNRNEVNNIYSNKKFYHNKTFFRESKSVKNFLLDLKRKKFFKEKEKDDRGNNSVTFRKNKKIKINEKDKDKEKDSTLYAEKGKQIFKNKKDKYKLNENNNNNKYFSLNKFFSLKKQCTNNNNNYNTINKNRDLSHSTTKNSYKIKPSETLNKNHMNDHSQKMSKLNIHVDQKKGVKKIHKLIKAKEKNITNINKFEKSKKNNQIQNKIYYNKNNTKSKTIKPSSINEEINTKSFSSPLSLLNSSRSQKSKQKEYPNMVLNKPKIYSKRIKSINSICKVGDSGTFQKKLNQDNYFITPNFLGNSDYYFLGVCDGHGIFGQNISCYLKEHLPINLKEAFLDQNIIDLSSINIVLLSEIIESIYKDTNEEMNSDERIDSTLSGSTCVGGLFTPSRFFCINVGDSRCVLFKYDKSKNIWSFSNLSRDHKPNDINEKKRIIEKGGIVEPYKNEEGNFLGPERVWINDIKKKGYPGLAMSRSFGDQVAHSVGVVVSPEILEHKFSEEDKVILLASDGVWEFLSNEDIMEFIKEYYEKNDMEGALDRIYFEADKIWREKEGLVDDITAIILLLG